MTDLTEAKAAARHAAMSRRRICIAGQGEHLADTVLAGCAPPTDSLIAGFWPIGDEIDVCPLMLSLARRGHTICLPETPKRGLPLIFRRWQPGDALVPGRFGTSHPTGDIVTPDFILVPLLAFDRTGNRLGYGAGYYDRTLASLPHAFRLGCAYAAQEVELVPTGPFDQRLDAIATEQALIRTGRD